MSKNRISVELPRMYDATDKIFNLCSVQICEFAEFITGLKGFEEPLHQRYLSDDFKDLYVDHVRRRENGDLAHLEHHSVLTSYWLKRDFTYVTTLHRATGALVLPFIFNTGKILPSTIEYASPNSFYDPRVFNTQDVEGTVRLNNIKYKLNHNQPINVFDVLDLIWMPTYRWDRDIEGLVMELIEIYNSFVVDEHLLEVLRKSLVLWVGKYVFDEENIEKVIGDLKMSAEERFDMRNALRGARIDGMMMRAEEAGKEAGKLEDAKNMLDKGFSIDVVVDVTGLSEEFILKN